MVKIEVNQKELDHIINSIEKIKNIAVNQGLKIAEESAREYSNQVKSNIVSQKYGNFGFPHKKWKDKAATASKFWFWLGTVFSSLSPKKLKQTKLETKWRVGFYNFKGGIEPTKVSKPVKETKKTENPVHATEGHSEVKHYGPNSELVQRLNRERGFTK